MIRSFRRISVLCFLLSLFIPAFAQIADIRYLTIEKGLSNNSVRSIYQDDNGLLWFGTYDGLNCYDGYSFRIYRNNRHDSNSLPHNYINAIGEDHQHNLLIGTGQGVGVYNSLTQTFSRGRFIRAGGTRSEQIGLFINDIKTDTKGNVYIATNGGGLLVKPAGSDISFQIPYPVDVSGNQMANMQSLVVDKAQRVWVVVANTGLFQYDTAARQLRLMNAQLQSVRCMEADNQQHLWIGAYDGLYKFDMATGAAEKISTDPAKKAFSNILTLKFDSRNTLWMGMEGGGIDMLDPVNGHFTRLQTGRKGLSSDIIYAIYEDKDDRKWIGTHKGGIDIIEPRQNGFFTVDNDPVDHNSLSNNFVSSLYEAHNKDIWIGTDGGGITVWNRQKEIFTRYAQRTNPSASNSIPAIVEDGNNFIWTGSYGSGIDRFDTKNHTWKHYTCFNDRIGKENPYIWRLFLDSHGSLWATTYAGGLLYFYNRETDRFQPFSYEQQDFYCLAEDHEGQLWAGSPESLCKIDRARHTYSWFSIPKPVRTICESRSKDLWIGTEGAGLMKFDVKTNTIVASYTEEDGLCNNSVLNMLEDDNGELWLSTFHGLSRFDPRSGTFRNFYQEDGLQSDQYEYNAALRLRSGELAFGGIKGFTIFHPDSLRLSSVMPPLLITKILVDNSSVNFTSKYVAATSGDRITRLVIPYEEGSLAVEFAALEYTAPDKTLYTWYLEGWEKGWNAPGSSRTATYSHLEEGSYKLHIKATNKAGEWNTREWVLGIKVLPPWYRTWIAYVCYSAILLGIGYLVIQYRNYRNRLQYKMKLIQLRSEQEKKFVLLERAQEKDLNEKKMSLFTRIAHEFRTPLTLVINPVQDLLREEADGKNHPALNSIYRNARRLLSLTDQLLLFQKTNTGEDPLIVAPFNYTALCREVYSYFEQDAQTRKIRFQLIAHENIQVYGDRQKLEIVLINLLSNAFKYTAPKGAITFEVSETPEEILTSVTDTGQGIPPEAADRIFDYFYQVSNNQFPSKPGFGIGLFLTKTFVTLHKGQISYSSQAGTGTSFRVSLLKGYTHFDQQPIIQNGEEQKPGIAGSQEKPMMENTFVPDKDESREDEKLISDDRSILLIEDNKELRTYLAETFNKKYKVLEAESAEDGLVIAKDSLPDLIITDIMMREMTGIDLCRILKQDPSVSHIPIIILTAGNSQESRLQATELGADDFFNKPFDKDLLIARVASLLKNKTILQNYFYNEITLQKNDVKVSEEYKLFLEHCISVVEENLDNPAFSVHMLAAAIGMSHSKLYKKVKSVSGLSINAFIRYIRLRKAAGLFINTDLNINQTAFQVGFNDVKYFQKQFLKLFGINPSEYIKKYRKGFAKGYRINKDALGKSNNEDA